MSTGIDRIGALKKAFEFIYKSETYGDYYEFGVYQGVSLIRAMQAEWYWQKKTNRQFVNKFYGFDSFNGLPTFKPEDKLIGYEVFQEKQFNDTSISIVEEKILQQGLNLSKVTLFSGLFSVSFKSLKVLQTLEHSSIAIAHIDCDLYSSALECLKFVEKKLVDGAIILFDDWFCYKGRPNNGVHRAFIEWLSNSNFIASEYFNYSWAGKAFIMNTDANQ